MIDTAGLTASAVRVVPRIELDSTFAAGRLAEITHLPTGVASGQLETVTIAPGQGLGPQSVRHEDTLLHVVTGTVQVRWGDGLEREVRAGPGDTVLVPGGTAYRAGNGSQTVALQLIRVQGG